MRPRILMVAMSDVTHVLARIAAGDAQAAEQLLPLVYDELRKLAAARLAQEKPGQTLQATALVHEAWLRIAGPRGTAQWDNRGHFFAAAAEAMRRILVENARRKKSLKHGGQAARLELEICESGKSDPAFDLLDLDDALSELERHDAAAAQLVKLRYFAGFGHEEAAAAMGMSRREADRLWALARAWLFQHLDNAGA